jgi:hypothetical protein
MVRGAMVRGAMVRGAAGAGVADVLDGQHLREYPAYFVELCGG